MIYLISILIYLFFLTGVGLYRSRQVKTGADFAVAGRSLSPWVVVLTMLAVWIGTGSIVGAAEKTYETGLNALFLPLGTLFGMLILTQIAGKARGYEVYTVPEIIGNRYGSIAKMLAVISLIIAYMVIVSYQFNAGGAVLEVITGEKERVVLKEGNEFSASQLKKGQVRFYPEQDWQGEAKFVLNVRSGDVWLDKPVELTVKVVDKTEVVDAKKTVIEGGVKDLIVIKMNDYVKYNFASFGEDIIKGKSFKIVSVPEKGTVVLEEPVLTAQNATIIAAIFIIIFTMLAGMKSLASCDVFNGSLIVIVLIIAFPYLLIKAGGFSGMAEHFAAMGDKPNHMDLFGTFKSVDYINWLLPTFLLVMGDANQYQRFFSSRNVRGAKQAAYMLVVAAIVIELLIVACAWIAASMTPDPANGKYILIYAARHFMHPILGIFFMTTAVAIIVSTADSFLLVPATTFMRDVYMKYINTEADEKKVVMTSRILVVVFGIIAYLVSLMFAESTGFFAKAMLAYTIYGSAITPCLVAALFWKRATKTGAISSIIAGIVMTLCWDQDFFVKYFVSEQTYAKLAGMVPGLVKGLEAVLPAITVSVIVLIVVSLLTQKKKEIAEVN